MKYELFDFQKAAVHSLIKKMESMRRSYDADGSLSAVALTAPTGSGKTVIAAAVAEGLFYGNDVYGGDSRATILWLSDSPSLNRQTMKRFDDATDLLTGATAMEAIGPDFAKSNRKLRQGRIYFLNRQLLSKNGKLSSEAEGGRSFYDVLKETIEDSDIHLYLFIDEAHRGLGTGDNKATSDNTNKTIYARVIDGQEGKNPPMPVVVGISATPERFNNAMQGRVERDVKAAVNVPVSDVKASGLIKDTIELRTPTRAANTKHQDLTQACIKLAHASKLWKKYCIDHAIYPIVTPLMVVQVEDRVSDETLSSLCAQIHSTLQWLDVSTCFANVFSGEKDIVTPNGRIPYIDPEKVSDRDEVRVLFAKDAVTTGWDCPRAEVIYSRRKRSDPTYIAQLIGRMVRTPLARRISKIEELNCVSCYLPEYDAETVENVVLKLKEDHIDETSDISVNAADVTFFGDVRQKAEDKLKRKEEQEKAADSPESREEEIPEGNAVGDVPDTGELPQEPEAGKPEETPGSDAQKGPEKDSGEGTGGGNAKKDDPDEFSVTTDGEWDDFSEDITETKEELQEVLDRIPKVDSDAVLACFESIITRQVRHSKPNRFRDLWECVDIIVTDLNPGSSLDEDIDKEFYRNVEAEIQRYPGEFGRALGDIRSTQISIKRIDPLTGEEFEDRVDLVENDKDRLAAYYKNTVQTFSGASDRIKYCINRRMTEEYDSEEAAIRRLCAVGACVEIVHALEDWAEKKTENLLDLYESFGESVSEENKEKWNVIVGNAKPWVESRLSIRSTNTHQNTAYDRYEKHIISDKDGWAYLNIKQQLEKDVLRTELSHPMNVAWYRNEARNLRASFSIPYDKDLGLENMYPDFIFFQSVGGTVRPSIVDPHGDWLGDSIGKLRGYVNYLRDHPDIFVRVLAVADEKDGEVRYLDLMKPEIQEEIMNYSGNSAKGLFNGPLSRQYRIVEERQD